MTHKTVFVALIVSAMPARAGGIEHWTCQEKIGSKAYSQDYTLADNRMFAPKGKGSWSLVYNSDATAFAYFRVPSKDVATNYVWVLDKRAGKLVFYDDAVANRSHRWNPSIEPDIQVSDCIRKD